MAPTRRQRQPKGGRTEERGQGESETHQLVRNFELATLKMHEMNEKRVCASVCVCLSSANKLCRKRAGNKAAVAVAVAVAEKN